MSCQYRLDDLLQLLRERAPEMVDVIANRQRSVEDGLLSVGLKIHCLDHATPFFALIERLGGTEHILEVNHYRNSQASFCLVLPPVGNASSAVLLLEAIEQFVGTAIFGNPEIQIQVCSPGRLAPRHAALLAISFYLGSDTLRRYRLEELETTFTTGWQYPRGRRLVLYDADGDFDPEFEWWRGSSGVRIIEPKLPLICRSDVLVGSGSQRDIENINLVATLLIHIEHDGYWKELGVRFERDMIALLERHLLAGLAEAPWVRTPDPTTDDDDQFFAALQELVA